MDNTKKDSGNLEMLRVITYVHCIISAIVLYPGEKSDICIRSLYDRFMFDHKTVEASIWRHLSMSLVLIFIVSAAVLIINGIYVRKNNRTASAVDIIFYSILALSVPAFLGSAMVLNRASLVINKKTIFLLVIMIIYIVIAAVVITHTVRRMDHFQAWAILFVLLLYIPYIPLRDALSEFKEYKSNYGTFIAGKVTSPTNSEMDLGNRNMLAREYEGKLYYIGHDEIYMLDNDEPTAIVTVDREVDGRLTAFDVYDGKIYYALDKDDELRIMCNDMNGSDVLVYSEPSDWFVDLMIIKDGVMYYNAEYKSIRYIDLTADTLVSNLYIADLKIELDEYPMLIYGYEERFLDIHNHYVYRANCYSGNVYYFDFCNNGPLYCSGSDTPLTERGICGYNICNDKIYFTCEDERNVLRCMDLDGSNETVVNEFDDDVGRIYSASGHVYVKLDHDHYELYTVV